VTTEELESISKLSIATVTWTDPRRTRNSAAIFSY